MTQKLLPLVIALAAFAAGCTTPAYDARKAYMSGGFQRVITDTDDLKKFDDRNQTLMLNYRAHAKLGMGFIKGSERDFLKAWNIMNQGQGGGVAAARFWSEDHKYWMGDPYERAFNSWYLGMVTAMNGNITGAMPAFKNAIFVDTGDLEAGEFSADWLPALLMRARGYLARDDVDGAKKLINEINRLEKNPANFDPENPWLTVEAQQEANVCMMIELGWGPYFTAEGRYGEVRVVNQSAYRERYAQVFVDGEPLGETFKIGDTFFQAITRGGRVMDDYLEGKAIAKTATGVAGVTSLWVGAALSRSGKKDAGAVAAGVGVALLLASALTNPEADTRCNLLLPGETHLMLAKLEPGDYEVEVRFFDENGSRLRKLDQQNIPLTVPEEGDATLLLRSRPRYRVPNANR
ncbi:MAG: hypothetical protein ACYTDT_05040 [Planctomycetota bacterium]|jgi:hypothetical protein